MVEGTTESWYNIADAEIGLTGYEIFRKDRIGRQRLAVISYIKEYVQANEIKFEREVDCDEAFWYNIVTGNSTLTRDPSHWRRSIPVDSLPVADTMANAVQNAQQ